MNLKEWEPIIQEIVDAFQREKTDPFKHNILKQWRAKLEEEPTLLQPFQIDQIVREVRRRLESASR